MVDNIVSAEQQREVFGLRVQRRLGRRRAHLAWLGAVVALTVAAGSVHWFIIGSLLSAVSGHPELRPAFALGLTALTPLVLAAVLVPDTEPWARELRRASRATDVLLPRIHDGMAILGAYVMCLVLASLVLGPGANALAMLGLGTAAMLAVVVGWRWSAASRERTLRPFTAMQIVVLVAAGLWFVNLAAGGAL
jgi:MFS family permease